MSRQEHYECTVSRDEDGRVTAIAVEATDLEARPRAARLNGGQAARVAGQLHDILRSGGVTGRAWTGPAAIPLDQVRGAQVELLVLAVKPLRRGDRIDQVAEGVATMSREEASYWHAKTTRPGGLRALRVLLTAGGIR